MTVTAADLKSRLDLEQIVASHGVELRPDGARLKGLCPFHSERTPSFTVYPDKQDWSCYGCQRRGDVFDFLGHCRYNGSWTGTGEQFKAVLAQAQEIVGVASAPLTRPESHTHRINYDAPEAVYEYRNPDGTLTYQTLRYKTPRGKTFRQRRPDGRGGWDWSLGDTIRVPYRLPELIAAPQWETVYIPEGEKCVEVLRELGLVATCNSEGAGKWRPELNPYFRDRHVCILPDNDEVGRKHADQVAGELHKVARRVKVLDLPGLGPKGDVADWITGSGGTLGRLVELDGEAPAWTPEVSLSRLALIQNNQENQANRERFRLVSLSDFLAEEPETTRYVWEETLPAGGMSMLGAKPKTGKTTAARNISLAVARGESVLGRGTTAGSVVYLALEEKRGELQRQFRAMGATDEPIYVHTGAAPQDYVAALREAIESVQPVLAVVDPLQDLARVRDMNDYSTVHAALSPVRDLARESGTHILLLHHNNKLDDLLGSTQLFGIVDTLLLMARRDEIRTLRSIQRYGEDLPETVLELDKETGLVTPVGEYKEAQLERKGEEILDALGSDELTEADIRERVGGNESQASKALRRLVERNQVVRTGAGKRGDPYVYSVSRLGLIERNRETE